MIPLIIKRNSKAEVFDSRKIDRVVKAAGLTEDQAKKLVETISQWVSSLNIEQLHSVQLRDKVLEEMRKLNKNAANMFAWYQKTKEGRV